MDTTSCLSMLAENIGVSGKCRDAGRYDVSQQESLSMSLKVGPKRSLNEEDSCDEDRA